MSEPPEEIVPVRDALRTLFDGIPEDASLCRDFRQLMAMLAVAKELRMEIERILPDFEDGPLKGVAEHVADELHRIVDEQIEAIDLPRVLEMLERRFA